MNIYLYILINLNMVFYFLRGEFVIMNLEMHSNASNSINDDLQQVMFWVM